MTLTDVLRAARAAWWGAWVVFAWLVLANDARIDDLATQRIVLSSVLACGACSALVLARRPLASLACGALVIALALAHELALLAAVALASASVFAWLLARARWPRLRLAMHGLSFFGTFAVALPLLASSRVPEGVPFDAELLAAPLPLLALAQGAALVSVLIGTTLMALATGVLTEGGGTADPIDPPLRYQTGGIYAWLRHPMQIGEIFIVLAAALALGTRGALVYSALFALALVLPFRRLEERWLARRFGPLFSEHRRRVDAFLPRRPASPLR